MSFPGGGVDPSSLTQEQFNERLESDVSVNRRGSDGNRFSGSGDGSRLKSFGTAAQGAGLGIQLMSILGASKINRAQIRSNAAIREEAQRKQLRAEFGSSLVQAGTSGLTLSSFTDIFNNQTIEDALSIAQLKQQKFNQIAADKNAKRRAITGLAAQAASLGASGGSLGGAG